MKGVFEIATLLVGVSVLTLILNPKANTVPVVKAAGQTFNELLRTVTLQTGFGTGTTTGFY